MEKNPPPKKEGEHNTDVAIPSTRDRQADEAILEELRKQKEQEKDDEDKKS